MTLSEIERSILTSRFPTWVSCVFWILFQVTFILVLELLGLRPSRLFGASYFGGPAGGISAYSFYFTCLILCVAYTWIGLLMNNKYPLNSSHWWKAVVVLYVAYAVISIVGLYAFIGEWFFDGFGQYIADVWFAPILWLGELEVFNLVKKKLDDDSWRLFISVLFWITIQALSVIVLSLFGVFQLLWYIAPKGNAIFPIKHYDLICCAIYLFYVVISCSACLNVKVNSRVWWNRMALIYLLYVSLLSSFMLFRMGSLMCVGFWKYLIELWVLPLLWFIEIETLLLFSKKPKILKSQQKDELKHSDQNGNSC